MAYMKRYLEDGIDPGVDIHSLMDAPHDEIIMRKRKSKNYGVGTSSPHPFPNKKPNKSETSRKT